MAIPTSQMRPPVHFTVFKSASFTKLKTILTNFYQCICDKSIMYCSLLSNFVFTAAITCSEWLNGVTHAWMQYFISKHLQKFIHRQHQHFYTETTSLLGPVLNGPQSGPNWEVPLYFNCFKEARGKFNVTTDVLKAYIVCLQQFCHHLHFSVPKHWQTVENRAWFFVSVW